MSDLAVVTCALTGVLTDPARHPVPVTVEQMAASAREAFDAGAAIDARSTSGPTGRAGQTPLMLAAQSSRKYNSMRFLLSRGARLDLRDNTGADVAAIMAADGRPNGRAFRAYFDQASTDSFQRWLDSDYAKAKKLVADVRAAGTWARYLHEPRVRLDVLRILLARGRAKPPVRMRTRRRSGKDLVPCLFTELPADVFRHAIGFWRSDRDSDDSDEDY